MAKVYFKDHGIEFVDKDVTDDESLQQEMIKKSSQFAVPVIDIAGTIIVGFQKDKIEAAIAAANK